MAITITGNPGMPSLADPADFNADAIAFLTWLTKATSGGFIYQLENMDASDYFTVQSSTSDSTTGKVQLVGYDGNFAKVVIAALGTLTINGTNIWAETITIADDAVGIVDLPTGRTGSFVFVTCQGQSTTPKLDLSGIYHIDAGTTPEVAAVYEGASASSTTGTLSGTTGVDGEVTIAPNASAQVQIENRRGSSASFQVVMV